MTCSPAGACGLILGAVVHPSRPGSVVSTLPSAWQVHNHQVCETSVMTSRAYMGHPAQRACAIVTTSVSVEWEQQVRRIQTWWRCASAQGKNMQHAVPAPHCEGQPQVCSAATRVRAAAPQTAVHDRRVTALAAEWQQ